MFRVYFEPVMQVVKFVLHKNVRSVTKDIFPPRLKREHRTVENSHY